MSGSVAGYTIEEVCRLIDRSWSMWREKYAAAPGVERLSLPDAGAVISEFDLPNINTVFEARLGGADTGPRIRQIQDLFRERSLRFTWWVGPISEPPDLAPALSAAGLREGIALVGMAGDLDDLDLDPAGFGETDPGSEPVRILDQEGLKDFCLATAQAYSVPAPGGEILFACQSGQGYGPKDGLAHFTICLEGRAAATASVMMRGTWALLAGVGTVPEARGKGLGTAVTKAALAEARARGCRLAVLQASAGGRPIYEKLGFAEYCRLRRFIWSPDGN